MPALQDWIQAFSFVVQPSVRQFKIFPGSPHEAERECNVIRNFEGTWYFIQILHHQCQRKLIKSISVFLNFVPVLRLLFPLSLNNPCKFIQVFRHFIDYFLLNLDIPVSSTIQIPLTPSDTGSSPKNSGIRYYVSV